MNFFDRYSQVCKDKGIEPCSQAMADKIGTNRSTISQWGTRNNSPKGEVVAAIANVLGVSADYLLFRTDDPTDYTVKTNTPVAENTTFGVAKLYSQLDEIDKVKVEAYIQGLLAADKYSVVTALKQEA